jgi:hypothetical protein
MYKVVSSSTVISSPKWISVLVTCSNKECYSLPDSKITSAAINPSLFTLTIVLLFLSLIYNAESSSNFNSSPICLLVSLICAFNSVLDALEVTVFHVVLSELVI